VAIEGLGRASEGWTASRNRLSEIAGLNRECPTLNLECIAGYIASGEAPPVADVHFLDAEFAEELDVSRTMAAKELSLAVEWGCQGGETKQ